VVDVMRLLRAHGLAPVRSSGSTRRPASCSSWASCRRTSRRCWPGWRSSTRGCRTWCCRSWRASSRPLIQPTESSLWVCRSAPPWLQRNPGHAARAAGVGALVARGPEL